MVTEAQNRATNKYRKKAYKQLNVSLSVTADKDIIEFLEIVPNKNEFIKRIIREKMPK